MKYAAPARQALKIKTIMNLIGPLSNPASAEYQLIGVYDIALVPLMARAAQLLGTKRVLVVHGFDGEDELSVTGKSIIGEISEDGSFEQYEFDPVSACSIRLHDPEELRGADAKVNAEFARQIMGGQGNDALRDSICLNAGAALYIYGLASDISGGFIMAGEALASGAVARKLEDSIYLTKRVREGQ